MDHELACVLLCMVYFLDTICRDIYCKNFQRENHPGIYYQRSAYPYNVYCYLAVCFWNDCLKYNWSVKSERC